MPTEQKPPRVSVGSLIGFFALAYLITWGLSVFSASNLLPFAPPSPLVTFAAVFLHYGPSLAAIIVVAAGGGRAALGAFLKRLGQWRVGWPWYLFLFVYPAVLRLLAVGIDVALGGRLPTFFGATDVPAGNPLLLLPIVFLAVMFQAGLAEEIGWRGFGLPGLQQRFSALTSSLILGIAWCFWHFHPSNLPSLAPLAPWYVFNTIALTIVMTWLFNNTRGSLLIAVLFHTVSNVSDWIVPVMPTIASASGARPFIIQGVLVWLTALTVIVIHGPENLSRKHRRFGSLTAQGRANPIE